MSETITTVEELDALADDTILRGREGQAYLIAGRRIFGAGNDQAMAFREIEAAGMPATVLYRPDRPQAAPSVSQAEVLDAAASAFEVSPDLADLIAFVDELLGVKVTP